MFRSIGRQLLNRTGRLYRSAILKRPIFIAVTGSCGKTTTKELVAAVLSSRFRGRGNIGTCNTPYHVVRMVLKTNPRDDFCVLEIAAADRVILPLELPLGLIQPKIGVVTNIGLDHVSLFGSQEAIAAEKGKLVAALPPDGTAVLNADDPLVMGMQSRCAGRVVTYGLSSTAMFRAEDICSDWPERLSLTAHFEGQSIKVETQLCGTHWAPNILAAMAVGHVMGISLTESADAICRVPPVDGRMCPVTTSDGVNFICDCVKVPVWTVPASLDFMRRATAKRKLMVVGTLSDYQQPLDPTYSSVARQAREVCDFVFFVGRWASRCLLARRYPEDDAVQAFVTVDHLTESLRDFLLPGDLVLIRGSEVGDGFHQVAPKWIRQRETLPSAAVAELPPLTVETNADHAPNIRAVDARQTPVTQIIVGLGNPGKKYQNTPHNVGQQTLDLMAVSLQAEWRKNDGGLVAQVECQNQQILLVKPGTFMNDTGPWLLRLAEQFGFGPQDCVLIQDDVNLDPGVVRNKMSGSSGGHKGVQSIVAAFQTEGVRRVKIGVGRPSSRDNLVQYVLTPFDAARRKAMDCACQLAARRVMEMLTQPVEDA